MKTKSLILMAVAVLTLSSCRNRETALTGSYGSSFLSGQVVMTSGSSPAGVEVSVIGTGMRTEVGEDGRFAFMGVPGNAELQFSRGDGIDSKVFAGAASNLVVELNGTTAFARRRGAGRSQQYEGLIAEVGDASLKVFTSHKEEVEIAVDEDTVIRHGNTTYELEELEDGWRVHVKAVLKDDVLTALEIMVQNTGENGGGAVGSTMTANGPVTAKGDDGSLTVQSQPKGEVTVQTDENTIIRKQGQIITVDAINVGDEINTMGERVDDTTLLARQIEVRGKGQNPGSGNGGGNGKGKGPKK
jgi:hypothetical protein